MANMSYCRFRNTLQDFQDCLNALENEGYETLSAEELRAAKELVELSESMTDQFQDIFDYRFNQEAYNEANY